MNYSGSPIEISKYEVEQNLSVLLHSNPELPYHLAPTTHGTVQVHCIPKNQSKALQGLKELGLYVISIKTKQKTYLPVLEFECIQK
ncbi:MAG: hypothetical protein ACI86H_000720 [bacterium]|jgi:hypothetical protein